MDEAAYHAILRRLGIEPRGGAPGLADRGSISLEPAPPTAEPGALSRRRRAFEAQLAAWRTSTRGGVPLLALPDVEARRQPGTWGCVSCGVPIAESRLRCECCRRAAELVLGLAPVDERSEGD